MNAETVNRAMRLSPAGRARPLVVVPVDEYRPAVMGGGNRVSSAMTISVTPNDGMTKNTVTPTTRGGGPPNDGMTVFLLYLTCARPPAPARLCAGGASLGSLFFWSILKKYRHIVIDTRFTSEETVTARFWDTVIDRRADRHLPPQVRRRGAQ